MNYSKEISNFLEKFDIDILVAFDIIAASQCYKIKKKKKINGLEICDFRQTIIIFV